MAKHFSPRHDVTDDNIDHDIDLDKEKEDSEVHPLQLSPSSEFLSSSQLAEDDYHFKSSILSIDDIDHDKGKENSVVHPLQLSPSLQLLLSSQLAEDDYHLKSSIPSNVAFLLGSALFFTLSRIALITTNEYYDTSYEDYDYEDSYEYNDDYESEYDWNHYKGYNLLIVSISGGLFLIANATWEIYWCFGREREWREQIDAGYASDNEEENEAYHREERQNLSSAMAFVTAASIDLGSLFIDEEVAAIAWVVSANTYLLSAILSLRGTVLSCPSLPTGLALVGDILFALASVIDVAVSLISEPELFHLNERILAQWGCVSSTLWLIDASLYFAADMTVVWYRYKLYREEEKSASGDKQYGFDTVKSLT